MAISYINSNIASATTVTIPAHNVGDLLIIFAHRSTTTAPTLPSGWTNVGTGSTSGNSNSMRVGYKIATSTSDTSGTWTNATELNVVIYRGASGVGASSITSTATGTSGNIPALTLTKTDGTSWVVGAMGSNQITSTSTPTGMVQRATKTGTADMEATFDSNGTVTLWAAHSLTLGSTAVHTQAAVEILMQNTAPTVSLTTADASSFSTSTPTLGFTGTDVDGNAIAYELQIDTLNTFNGAGTSSATATIIAYGAGGGGGGADTNTLVAGSGGGGAGATRSTITVSNGTSYNLSVGTPGSGGAAGFGTATGGGVGGDSWFSSSTTILAKGGNGGAAAGGAGGTGGAAASGIGTTRFSGGTGGIGAGSVAGGGGGSAGDSGNGGNSTANSAGAAGADTYSSAGAGASGVTVAAPGNVGGTPGGGGSGGSGGSGNGGIGGYGMVVVIVPVGLITSAVGGSYQTDGTNDFWLFTSGGAATWTPTFNTGPLIDALSASSAGFVDTTAGGTSPFASGDAMTYTVQSGAALANGTYYWRARGIDPSGSNTFGSWATTRSFTVSISTPGNTGQFFAFF